MKNGTVFFAVLFFAAIFLCSCNKEEITSANIIGSDVGAEHVLPTVVNDIVKFDSATDFERFYNHYAQGDVNEASEVIIPSKLGHNSIVQILNDFEKLANNEQTTLEQAMDYMNSYQLALYINKDSTIESVIEDPILSAILNKWSVFQIADTLYHIRRNEVRSITLNPYAQNIGDVLLLLTAADLVSNDVSVQPIHREKQDIYIDRGGIEKEYTPHDPFCKPTTCYDNYKKKHRLRGKLWKFSIFFLKAAGASSKSQRKRWWFWFGKKVDRIYVSVTPVGSPTKTKTRSRKSQAKIITAWSVKGPDVSIPMEGIHEFTNGVYSGYCTTCRQ